MSHGWEGRCATCGRAGPEGDPCAGCGGEVTDPWVGLVLDDGLEVHGRIAGGGTGRVYLGFQSGLQRRVAIKRLHPEVLASADGRIRFAREARVLARLNHPGIVAAFESGTHQGEPWLAMEFIEGVTLGRERRQRRPSSAELCDWMLELAEALQAAHEAGVIHRDLKPENLFLVTGKDGGRHVRVVDFGLSLVTDDEGPRLTATRAIAGTPAFMSPEQCRGRDVGPGTDIYSFGATLHALITGSPPFMADTAADVIAQHLFVAPPTAPSEPGDAIGAALAALAHRCLAKRPETRPALAEVIRELKLMVEGRDATTRGVAASTQRVAAAGLDRESRGLPQPEVEEVTLRGVASEAALAVGVHGFPPAREQQVVTALAVHGLLPRPIAEPKAIQAEGLTLLVVPGDAATLDAVRAALGGVRCLLLAVDVPSDGVLAAIRGGASDACHLGESPDVWVAKARRLLRRGR